MTNACLFFHLITLGLLGCSSTRSCCNAAGGSWCSSVSVCTSSSMACCTSSESRIISSGKDILLGRGIASKNFKVKAQRILILFVIVYCVKLLPQFGVPFYKGTQPTNQSEIINWALFELGIMVENMSHLCCCCTFWPSRESARMEFFATGLCV